MVFARHGRESVRNGARFRVSGDRGRRKPRSRRWMHPVRGGNGACALHSISGTGAPLSLGPTPPVVGSTRNGTLARARTSSGTRFAQGCHTFTVQMNV